MLTPDITLIRASDLIASPWKNGGGTTRELACHPAGAGLDDFIWRVSIADVAQAGPFSCFNGIDRILVLLQGAGMTLQQADGVQHVLNQPCQAVHFQGETPITASLHHGPTCDFNLMTRRGQACGDITVIKTPGNYTVQGDSVLLFCVVGEAQVNVDNSQPVTLAQDDTLRTQATLPRHIHLQGKATLLLVTLFYQGEA